MKDESSPMSMMTLKVLGSNNLKKLRIRRKMADVQNDMMFADETNPATSP